MIGITTGELENLKGAITAFITIAIFGTVVYFCMFVLPDIVINAFASWGIGS